MLSAPVVQFLHRRTCSNFSRNAPTFGASAGDGLPALMMADQKGKNMAIIERNINTEDLISFEEIAKKHIAGEYLAIDNDGKSYHASYVPEYRPSGVMFFCIPDSVEILGYLEIV